MICYPVERVSSAHVICFSASNVAGLTGPQLPLGHHLRYSHRDLKGSAFKVEPLRIATITITARSALTALFPVVPPLGPGS